MESSNSQNNSRNFKSIKTESLPNIPKLDKTRFRDTLLLAETVLKEVTLDILQPVVNEKIWDGLHRKLDFWRMIKELKLQEGVKLSFCEAGTGDVRQDARHVLSSGRLSITATTPVHHYTF